MAQYSFDITVATPQSIVSPDALQIRINADPDIGPHCSDVSMVDYVEGVSGIVHIDFKAALNGAEFNTLTVILAAHDGQEPDSTKAILVQLDHPTMEDGKLVITPAPGTMRHKTWFTGRGDAAGIRGGGERLRMTFADAGDDSVEFSFSEPVELNDGQGVFTGAWDVEDHVTFSVIMPATVATLADPVNTGNVNEFALGNGAVRYDPAPGTGTHNVDLTLAAPVPIGGHKGQWESDYDKGTITPADPANTGDFVLYNFPVEAIIIHELPLGHPTGVLDVEVYKVDWAHQNWNLKLSVHKETAGAGKFAMWLLIFRPGNIQAIT